MDCRAWPSRHRPTLTVKNNASPLRGAPPPVCPEHPLVCCLSQSLFCSFMISSLPLSHAVTPPDATHRLLALFLSFFFFSLDFFLLQFSAAPFLSFSLSFSDSLQTTAVQQFVSFTLLSDSCTLLLISLFFFFLLKITYFIVTDYFITYFLILVLYYLFHCYWLLYYLVYCLVISTQSLCVYVTINHLVYLIILDYK